MSLRSTSWDRGTFSRIASSIGVADVDMVRSAGVAVVVKRRGRRAVRKRDIPSVARGSVAGWTGLSG